MAKTKEKAPAAEAKQELSKFQQQLAEYEKFTTKKAELRAKGKDGDAELKATIAAEKEWLRKNAKPLEKEYKKTGFIYRFQKRGEKAAIYEQLDRDSNNTVAFEVFLITPSRPMLYRGKEYEVQERYPGNSSFGLTAWAFGLAGGKREAALELAERRFKEIEAGKVDDVEEIEEEEEAA